MKRNNSKPLIQQTYITCSESEVIFRRDFSAEKEKALAFQYLRVAYKNDGEILFARTCNDRTKGMDSN
ncbi:hypothetical protein DUI87_07659 [Hirundo rustica rustica]|uniref:Uncharacterized protein n=1 Tax=Hirundo rustica rustica TaxID=333673 RepID=A0A3M0L8A5_HIRRU|nr:hypothetical protein DUI87_07659 [Hirundo rustica rustica]